MSAIDLTHTLDDRVYAQLSEWFGERVAESLIPDPSGFWPLTPDETRTAHAHYERWANQQENV